MTATLDPETIKAMIKQCCEQQTNRTVKSVTINVYMDACDRSGPGTLRVRDAVVQFENAPVANLMHPMYPAGTRSVSDGIEGIMSGVQIMNRDRLNLDPNFDNGGLPTTEELDPRYRYACDEGMITTRMS